MRLDGLRTFGQSLTSLVFPNYCPECQEEFPTGKGWACESCWLKLSPARKGLWAKQGTLKMPVFVAFHYNDLARTLIHQMKFYGREDIAQKLGRFAAERLLLDGVEWPVEAIVPIPLHPVRVRERGYDQNLSLAHGIAEITGLPIRTDLIRRTRHTSAQSRLSDKERLVNLLGAFELTSSSTDTVPSGILFVDDVIHTGATIAGCIDVLRQSTDFHPFVMVACG